MRCEGRRRRAAALLLCVASAAAAAPAPVGPAASVVTESVVDDFLATIAAGFCAPFATPADAIVSPAPSASAADPSAAFRDKFVATAPKLRAACLSRFEAAARSSDGPREQLLDRLAPRIAALPASELARARDFAASPAGRKLAATRRALDAEALELVSPWLAAEGPALYNELRLMMVGEIGSPPSPPKASAAADASVTPARVRNRTTLGASCASFYPDSSRRADEQGTVVLLVHVLDSGRIGGLLVETSSGYPALDVAAAACVGAVADFEPQRKDDRPVASWQRMKWTWRLDSPTEK